MIVVAVQTPFLNGVGITRFFGTGFCERWKSVKPMLRTWPGLHLFTGMQKNPLRKDEPVQEWI